MEQPKTNTNIEETKQKTPELPEVEKEFNIEDINKTLNIEEGILDSLNKYSKDEIFKDVDFEDNLKFRGVGVIDEKFDEIAYGKATVEQKILNFATLGLAKKDIGLIKSKERGLLNKDIFNKEIEGKVIEVREKKNKEERSATEKLIGDFHKELSSEDLEKRQIVKKFEVVDGKIIKIVQASRTEQGMLDAAGKLRDEKIGNLEKSAGAELIKEKEGLEKHYSTKEKVAEMTKYLSLEAKEEINKKISQEEVDTQERIKEKEENLKSELDVFRIPFQERLDKTSELVNTFSSMLSDTKVAESKYNNQLKNINMDIQQAQKSGLLEESKKEVVKELEFKKMEFEEKAKEFGEIKSIIEAKLGLLKTNKAELEKVASKLNGIGKTKKEIAEEDKSRKKAEKEKEPEEENTKVFHKIDLLPENVKKFFKNLPVDSRRVLISDESFLEDDIETITDFYRHLLGEETIKFGTGLKNDQIKDTINKIQEGRLSDIKFREEYKETKEAENEPKTDSGEDMGKEEVLKTTEKTFTEKEIENIVTTHLKIIGLSRIKDKKIQDQITKNAIGNVKKMIAKSEEPMTEIYIRKETKRVFDALSAGYFKRNK